MPRPRRTLVGDKAARRWPKDFSPSDLHLRFTQKYADLNGRAYQATNQNAEIRFITDLQKWASNYIILEGIERAVRDGVQSFKSVEEYIPSSMDEPDELYELKYLVEQTKDERASELYDWLRHSIDSWYVSRNQTMGDPRMDEIREVITRLYETR